MDVVNDSIFTFEHCTRLKRTSQVHFDGHIADFPSVSTDLDDTWWLPSDIGDADVVIEAISVSVLYIDDFDEVPNLDIVDAMTTAAVVGVGGTKSVVNLVDDTAATNDAADVNFVADNVDAFNVAANFFITGILLACIADDIADLGTLNDGLKGFLTIMGVVTVISIIDVARFTFSVIVRVAAVTAFVCIALVAFVAIAVDPEATVVSFIAFVVIIAGAFVDAFIAVAAIVAGVVSEFTGGVVAFTSVTPVRSSVRKRVRIKMILFHGTTYDKFFITI